MTLSNKMVQSLGWCSGAQGKDLAQFSRLVGLRTAMALEDRGLIERANVRGFTHYVLTPEGRDLCEVNQGLELLENPSNK